MKWTSAQQCAMQLYGRDILVSAAAGSGKTATLTERIIRSLTAPEDAPNRGDISRMLIVTFTRAAAAELRARISGALSNAIAACEDDRLRRHLNDQLLGLGSAHISTIDSFCMEIVRANFERLGLPAGFRLAEDSELAPVKEQLLSRLIDDGYRAASDAVPSDPTTPLDAITGNAFALAMDDFLPNRDRGDASEILLKLYERLLTFPEELEILRESADRLSREASLPVFESSEGRAVRDCYTPVLQALRDRLREALDILAMGTVSAKKIPMFTHDLEAVEYLLASFETGNWNDARACVLNYRPEGTLRGINQNNAPPHYERCKTAREDVVALLTAELPGYFTSDEAECGLRMQRTARTQRALYELLSAYDHAAFEEKKRRGTFDFTDIRRFTLNLLQDENGEPSDITYALRERFDAVYIDEYQDVDAVQDRIFSLIGAGGKRFMVGDIKQSIYGFRGADPSLFAHYKECFPPAATAESVPLASTGNRIYMSENFRCDPPVIHFTNDVCRYLFEVCPTSLAYLPSEDDLIAGKQNDGISAPVRIVLLKSTNTKAKKEAPSPRNPFDPEALYIANEIDRLLRTEHLSGGAPVRPQDIAVLVRAEDDTKKLIEALRFYGIPTGASPGINPANHPDMTMMINLLSVIDNPRDDISLMGLLSSSGSPIALADALTARNNRSSASLYDDLRNALTSEPCVFRENTAHALRAFFRQLDEWRSLAATLPADKLLRRMYAHPALAPIATSPVLLSIYEHARCYQNASFCGLYQFVAHFRRILEQQKQLSTIGAKETNGAVQIMTIHKSKGLEFPVVFLYHCNKKFNRNDENAAVVFDRSFGIATKQYCPESASMVTTLTREVIAHRIRESASEEEMRVLYVALTRARERLYLTANAGAATEERANAATRGDRHAIINASGSISWVLSALADANRSAPLDSSIVRVERIQAAELYDACQWTTAEGIPPAPAPVPLPASDADAAFYRNILKEHEHYVDPRVIVRRLPTKAAASKLRVAMLDSVWLPEEFVAENGNIIPRDEQTNTETEAYVRSRIELMQRAARPFDELLQAERLATPAERGTATHLFLQHCDFSRLAERGVDAELARLVKDGYLSQRAASIVRREQLDAFCQSDLFVRASTCAHRIFRELHFDRFIPYAHLTRNPSLAAALENYTLYVQGSLDLLLEENDGTIWLCDYKTDHILDRSDAGIRNQLLGSHADQLRIYADAVEGLFGRHPDHILIYSLPLGKSIDLTPYL